MLKLKDIQSSFKIYIIRCKLSIIYLFILSAAALPLSFIFPKLYQILIDDVMGNNQLNKLLIIIIGIVLLYLIQTSVACLKLSQENKLYKEFNIGIRSDIWHNTINMSFSDKEKYSAGDITQRMIDDPEKIGNFVKDQIVDRYYAYFMFTASTILILLIDPLLSIVCSSLIPVLLFINNYIGRKSSEVNEEIRQISNDYYGFTYNSLQYWKEIKVQNAEDSFVNKFTNYRNILSKLGLKSIKYWGYNEVFNDFKSNYLNKVFVYIIGAFFIIYNDLTVGKLIMFAEYYGFCFDSLNTVIIKNNDLKKNNPFYQRIIEMLDHNIRDDQRSKHRLKGDITVNNLFFSYGNDQILHNISFSILSGDKVAIIGESGCGKTTLIKNLLGMLTPKQGKIKYSDKSLNEIMLSDLYDQVGVVMQDPFYFNLTILENLRIAMPDASEEQIKKACCCARIYDFIESSEDGFNTVIGENGVKLSGGQKQRLAIAQALLRQPKILFLDEATSALDEQNEREILENIGIKYSDMTIILISHKPSVIKLMDKRINLTNTKELLYG